MTSGQGHDTLGSLTDNFVKILQILHGGEELWPGHAFLVCVHCDLDLRGKTSGQGHDTPLRHGQ